MLPEGLYTYVRPSSEVVISPWPFDVGEAVIRGGNQPLAV
jgi:hypothetical protein